jgi:signal transduction histidine kinase/ligand-binding sensor domain-containing protein
LNLKFLLLAGAVICSFIASGQTRSGFTRLGVNEGLSQNSVREIFQDRQGFIWIGTGDGLNRYDGIQIKKYRQSLRDKSTKRFPGKILNGKIQQDETGNLWMMVDGQLVQMNTATETFSVIKKIGGDLEINIMGLQGNDLYIAEASAVHVVNTVDRSSRRIALPDVFAHYTMPDNQRWLLYKKGNEVLAYNINTQAHTLLFSAGNNQLNGYVLSNSSLVISAADKIYDYNLPLLKITASYTIPAASRYKSLAPLMKTGSGDIISSIPHNGLTVIDSAKGLFYDYRNVENDPFSLSSNYIYTAVADASGNIWMGTEGGGISILNLKPPLFNCFPVAPVTKMESAFLMVKSIWHKDGKIYVGTYSKGLYIIDRHTLEHKVVFTNSNDPEHAYNGIFFIKQDDQGRVWLNSGTELGVADPDKGKFRFSAFINYTRKGKWHNILQCFAQVAPSRYIAGTVQSTYLVEEKDNKLTITDLGLHESQLEGDIQTIFKKENGDIIVGKGEGAGFVVIRLNENNKPQIIQKGLTGTSVKHVYRDNLRKAFWMATNAGIVIMRDNDSSQVLIDVENGLSNDFIYSIIPEDDYTFWVSTNKGINRIALEQKDGIHVGTIEQYAIQHGLQSNEFNTGGYLKDGRLIFFGGVTGVNWFDYSRFKERSFSPRSYVTDLLINDKPLVSDSAVNFLHDVRLNYNENNLLIRFATLDYTNPAVNQYRYRLAGYDKNWIDANNNPEARYSKLPHGRYRFEIKSSNIEGVWSSPVDLMSITITPPFWLTWWFYVLAAAGATALVFFGSRYYLKRKMEKKMRLMEKALAVNNERLRISRDMHDELGTGLSKIALLSEVGKNHQSPGKDDKIINEISDTSRKLADKMGEIIWTLNPHNDTLDNLSAYLKEYIYETTDSLPVAVQVDFPDAIPEIPIGHLTRQQLMLVTKEAINNALKYSKASQLYFSLAVHADTILFTIKDNGRGFDIGMLNRSRNGKKNGLANMRTRMDAIGGHFAMVSTPGAGTEIEYGIPVNTTFLP